MLSKLKVLFYLLFFAVDCSSEHGLYTFVVPEYVRENSPFQVSVSLSGNRQPSLLNISLTRDQFILIRTVKVTPGSTELISFQVPKLDFDYIFLNIIGIKGTFTKQNAVVPLKVAGIRVYIQMDRPKYKPGDLVQFRVICVDELTLLPVTNKPLDVLIYAGYASDFARQTDGDILVKRMNNIKLNQGVFKGQLQLANFVILGTWKIHVMSAGYLIKCTHFSVSRVFQPRFTVVMDTRLDVFMEDDQIKIGIEAKYVNDDPVRGKLELNFDVKQSMSYRRPQNFSKEMQIDGHEWTSIRLREVLPMVKPNVDGVWLQVGTLVVQARVTDSITKQVVEETAVIKFHTSPYKIKLDAPKYFDPKEPVHINVSVTDLQNNLVHGKQSPVNIWVKALGQEVSIVPQPIYMNGNGFGTAQVKLSRSKSSKYNLLAEYRGYKSKWREIRLSPQRFFTFDVLQPRSDLVSVEVRSSDPIGHFVYEIVSRENIFKAERVNVIRRAKTHILRIYPTPAMFPGITLYIHRVKSGKFQSAQKYIALDGVGNSIKINAESEVRPGSSVSLNISADEGSYVGLLAIDQRFIQYIESVFHQTHDLNRRMDFNKGILMRVSDSMGGLFTFANSLGENNIVCSATLEDGESRKLRNIFNEGWLFDDIQRFPSEGLRLKSSIPNTMISWAITGFSLSPVSGLSLTTNATKMRVFESFFVSMDLPTSIREGEILEIPVYVINNNDADALTEVTVESHSEYLLILDEFSRDSAFALNRSFSVSIPFGNKVQFTFSTRALRAGLFNITVKANSGFGSESVLKTLNVIPEGMPLLVTRSYLLRDSMEGDEILLRFPNNVVSGSEKIELSVVGDIFGPLAEGPSPALVPYGNGKEMTMHFISNVMILKYLKTFNLTNPSLERKAFICLETGYQSLLKMTRDKRKFSLFNQRFPVDSNTGILHTAIVTWGLQQAREFIQLGRKTIKDALNFVRSRQNYYGSFGKNVSPDVNADISAISLLASMQNDDPVSHYPEYVMRTGLESLFQNLSNLNSPMSVAFSKFVLVVGKHNKSQEILNQVSKDFNRAQKCHSKEYRPNKLSEVLDTTANLLFDLLQSQASQTDELIPLLGTLLASGHSDNIPTHLIAIDAMIGVAQKMYFGDRDLNIHFEGDRGEAGDLKVNDSNVHALQTVQLNSATRKVHIQSSGKGFAVVTIKSRYQIPYQNSTTSTFTTNVTVLEEVGAFISLKVCLSSPVQLPEHHFLYMANYTALEVQLPSGYILLEDQNDSPYNSNFTFLDIVKWETTATSIELRVFTVDSKAGSAYAIFENVHSKGSCIHLSAFKEFRVLNSKVVSVVVYNVFNETQKSTTFYELNLNGEQGADRK